MSCSDRCAGWPRSRCSSLLDEAVGAGVLVHLGGAPLHVLARHHPRGALRGVPRGRARAAARARRRGARVAQPERSGRAPRRAGAPLRRGRTGWRGSRQGHHLRAAGSPARARSGSRSRRRSTQFQRALAGPRPRSATATSRCGASSCSRSAMPSAGRASPTRPARPSRTPRRSRAVCAPPTCSARAALGFGGIGRERISADHDWIALLEEALVALGDRDSTLRARVQACLAMALYWSDSPERRDALSRDAVAMARRLGDTATLAFALDFRLKAVWGPGGVEERLATADEILVARHAERRPAPRARGASLEGGEPARAAVTCRRRSRDRRGDPHRRGACATRCIAGRAWSGAACGQPSTATSHAPRRSPGRRSPPASGCRATSPHRCISARSSACAGIQGRLGELTDALRALVDERRRPRPRIASAWPRRRRSAATSTLARRELDFLAAGRFAVLPHDCARLSHAGRRSPRWSRWSGALRARRHALRGAAAVRAV